MSTLHLIQGGTRIGDTFHICARLNEIDKEINEGYNDYNEVVWHHSEHEGPVARFLKEYAYSWLELEQHNIKLNSLPMDFRCVKFFRERLQEDSDFWRDIHRGDTVDDTFYQFKVDSPENPYSDCNLRFVNPLPELPNDLPPMWKMEENKNLERIPGSEQFLPYEKGEYIALQFDSRSDWKRIKVLTQVNIPLPVVSVGWPRECVWGYNCHSLNWAVTGKIIQDAACFVGINSACSVFAWYINQKQVVCHYEVLPDAGEPLGSRYFARKKTCRILWPKPHEDDKTLGGRIGAAVEELLG